MTGTGWPAARLAVRVRAGTSIALVLVGIGIGVALFVPVLASSPANAHNYCKNHVHDAGCVKNDHHSLDSCDREADGHRVRAWWWTSDGQGPGAWDDNGADSGCDRVWTINWTQAARTCEEVEGCSDWGADCCPWTWDGTRYRASVSRWAAWWGM
jgi:hypothetical protein